MNIYGLFFLKEGKPHVPVCEYSEDKKISFIISFISEEIALDYMQKNIHAFYRDILLIKKIEQGDLEKSIACEKAIAKKDGLNEKIQVFLNIREEFWGALHKAGA